MFVCFVSCVLSGRGLCWSLVQRSPTDCGAALCVITKARGRGGHSPRWAAGPEKKQPTLTWRYPSFFPQCIAGFPVFLKASSYNFHKQRYPVLGNRDMFFSWRWEQNFTVSLRWSSCLKTIIQWDA
jgi:hypothetical protein